MTTLLALVILTGAPARAQDPDAGNRGAVESEEDVPKARTGSDWAVAPYWDPISNLGGKYINGRITLQANVGISGGVRYFYTKRPNWYGFSRAQGVITQSLTHRTTGFDARLGSFFGIDPRYFRVTTGPDFFYDIYGIPFLGGGGDYLLEGTPGVAWDTQAYLKPFRTFWIGASITPGWVFNPDRRVPDLAPFHELAWTVTANYFGEFNLTVGWGWSKTAAGVAQGVILSSDF